jgi:hypothetical protein
MDLFCECFMNSTLAKQGKKTRVLILLNCNEIDYVSRAVRKEKPKLKSKKKPNKMRW